jgi:hypothetical protein
MAQGDTFINAVIGAVVSVVLSPLQFSPIIGGAVAGYLEGSETSAGVRVGALSGVLTAIPLILILGLFGGFFLVGLPFLDGAGHFFTAVPLLLIVPFVLVAFVFSIGLSAVGGYLGAYLRREDVI